MQRNFSFFLILPVITILFFAAPDHHAQAQQAEDPDALFEQARTVASDGNLEEARELALLILSEFPEYHDVRIFYARTLAWEQRFSDSRTQLQIVLRDEPEHPEALSARADVELWDGNFRAGLEYANRSIAVRPDQAGLYVQRARILIGLNRFSAALSDLDSAENLDAEHSERIQQLRNEIQQDQHRNIAVFGMSYDQFGDDLDPYQRMYGEYHRLTDYGPVIGRISVVHRFDITDWQAEIDSYPILSSNWYAYLNAGLSGGELFPEFRFGAELYRSLPQTFEGSAGLRYLNFRDDDVIIVTASISKYWRSWFFTFQPFFTPGDAGVNTAFNGIARKYFGDPLSYASLVGGFGFSPDDRRIIDGTAAERLLKSRYFGVDANYLVRNRLQLFGETKVTFQQFPFLTDYTRIITLETGIRYSF
ncbi:YaiO family outer membrane beta-barrel protein [Rhodohalobacter sp. SW132]|uniref:YaiO family outer membrane beta-barrel protein n=1 Tax=Rhodohalobacter sp. SW132 TaxID=2293433 RepID=UPI000E25564F|nr:YaiO family outer membrane beta-barrel protein [Rhodohalobacter sp. SW132]REL38946.1 YaiO family outer membrane beta-barrel protein [Rhodohalobacter sp. SW132]